VGWLVAMAGLQVAGLLSGDLEMEVSLLRGPKGSLFRMPVLQPLFLCMVARTTPAHPRQPAVLLLS